MRHTPETPKDEALDEIISRRFDDSIVPGLAVAIVHDGEVVHASGYGVTGVEDLALPVTPDTLFRIASTTKSLTGTAIMRLVDEESLDLDVPIREYAAGIRLDQSAESVVTLRMLLSHTAGLSSDQEADGSRDPRGLEDFVLTELPRHELVAPPGKVFSYSNTGIYVAGYIAQVVSGKQFSDLMKDLVFDPLNMARTTFDPLVAMTYPLAQHHEGTDDGGLRVRHRFAEKTASHPGGGAFSTVMDLANFAIMQMDQGRFRGDRIVSHRAIREMQSMQVSLRVVVEEGYGLTFFTRPHRGVRRVGQDGHASGIQSVFQMLPDSKTAVIMLNNYFAHFPTESTINDIFDRLLNLPKPKPVVPKAINDDRTQWPRLVGAYLGIYVGLVVIEAVNDRLVLRHQGIGVELQPKRRDVYFGTAQGEERIRSVGFVLDGSGPVEILALDGSLCRRWNPHEGLSVEPGILAGYAGTFRLPGATMFSVAVRVDEDALLITFDRGRDKGVEGRATPLTDTSFAWHDGVIGFRVDEQGQADSAVVHGTDIYVRSDDHPAK